MLLTERGNRWLPTFPALWLSAEYCRAQPPLRRRQKALGAPAVRFCSVYTRMHVCKYVLAKANCRFCTYVFTYVRVFTHICNLCIFTRVLWARMYSMCITWRIFTVVRDSITCWHASSIRLGGSPAHPYPNCGVNFWVIHAVSGAHSLRRFLVLLHWVHCLICNHTYLCVRVWTCMFVRVSVDSGWQCSLIAF
jgi:hypothetical protein